MDECFYTAFEDTEHGPLDAANNHFMSLRYYMQVVTVHIQFKNTFYCLNLYLSMRNIVSNNNITFLCYITPLYKNWRSSAYLICQTSFIIIWNPFRILESIRYSTVSIKYSSCFCFHKLACLRITNISLISHRTKAWCWCWHTMVGIVDKPRRSFKLYHWKYQNKIPQFINRTKFLAFSSPVWSLVSLIALWVPVPIYKLDVTLATEFRNIASLLVASDLGRLGTCISVVKSGNFAQK